MNLKEIGEFGFIDRIAPQYHVRPSGVVKGIGDDCAVIDTGGPEYLLVTTDLLVENVHFLIEWAPADIIGAKALSVNLSDIAACGGVPRDAFISLAIPEYIEVEWLETLYQGLFRVAHAWDVNVLGGDTTGSKGHLVINVTVTGLVPADQVLYRHSARPGDIIVMTGPTGRSAAGCEILLRGLSRETNSAESLVRAHLEPRPHVREARLLAQSGACNAAIDVSDGLSSDLAHVCRQSGLGAVIREAHLPVPAALTALAETLGKDPLHWVLHGGEEYVLLAAVKPEALHSLTEQARANGWELYAIGEFVTGSQIELFRVDGTAELLRARGWDHFR